MKMPLWEGTRPLGKVALPGPFLEAHTRQLLQYRQYTYRKVV